LLPILTGYLGLLLQGASLLAVGTFLSTTTRNQIVASVATFGACLMLWVIDWASSVDPTAAWSKAVSYLSVIVHFEPFSKGVVDTKDVIFFASLIFLGLFLTARSLESLRWRS
jgi:ABC-2 type transport system permease protein